MSSANEFLHPSSKMQGTKTSVYQLYTAHIYSFRQAKSSTGSTKQDACILLSHSGNA